MHKLSSRRAIATHLSSPVKTRPLIYGLAFIILVTIAGLFLALQGWKSRNPAFDMLTYIYNADAFLEKGAFPQYGDISSYGSFSTPGTSWLMMPGMLAFDDPRLYEKAGSIALHFGTLAGIFLLALAALGPRGAYVSVVLYGLSGIGLSFAGSLWPIGHPFFYVWMAYFACLWVTRKNPRYFVAAVVTWATGMYVDMAITPALAILPAIWLVYRPPIFSWHLLAGGALILALWYPYLHFEAGRGYADIKSQLLRQHIVPANFKDAWCNADLILNRWDDTASQKPVGSNTLPALQSGMAVEINWLFIRASAVKDGLLSNLMANIPILGFSVLLLLVLMISVVGLGLPGLPTRFVEWITGARFLPRPVAAFAGRLSSSATSGAGNKEIAAALVLCLLIPWFILLVVAEPGRSERFLWLWPLQVILLAAAVTNLLPRLRSSNTAGLFGQLALIVFIAPAAILSSVKPWFQNGWAGIEAEEVQVAEYLAGDLHAQGKDQAAIGYHLFIYPFMASYHMIDPHYKVGAEFDLLFKYMHGISNNSQCGEGVSPHDEYRVVQLQPEHSEAAPRHYFETSLDKNYQLVRQFEHYQVFKRD